jgi:hypothetical protein
MSHALLQETNAPTERPINWKAHEVVAALAGRKTQMRIPLNPKPWYGSQVPGGPHFMWSPGGASTSRYNAVCSDSGSFLTFRDQEERRIASRCPLGRVGDTLWVREAWQVSGFSWNRPAAQVKFASIFARHYRATDRGEWKKYWGGWRPAGHMPRELSRISLEITNVRVQRLWEISEQDAIADGLAQLTKDNGRTWKYGMPDLDGLPGNDDYGWHWKDWEVSPIHAFARQWTLSRGQDSWTNNPFVWAITFRVCTPASCLVPDRLLDPPLERLQGDHRARDVRADVVIAIDPAAGEGQLSVAQPAAHRADAAQGVVPLHPIGRADVVHAPHPARGDVGGDECVSELNNEQPATAGRNER